ncbi:hypothetical protein KFE25_003460 [Diacronema lutheri]|uniref:Uncharacterized protein n=1 Tax=Diacronema lutheri TaxID=2081491 RepID=A0A8J5XHY4_DIALT|nr:hypothetical protein KFE25_003460 [Diacronema lutheri]
MASRLSADEVDWLANVLGTLERSIGQGDVQSVSRQHRHLSRLRPKLLAEEHSASETVAGRLAAAALAALSRTQAMLSLDEARRAEEIRVPAAAPRCTADSGLERGACAPSPSGDAPCRPARGLAPPRSGAEPRQPSPPSGGTPPPRAPDCSNRSPCAGAKGDACAHDPAFGARGALPSCSEQATSPEGRERARAHPDSAAPTTRADGRLANDGACVRELPRTPATRAPVTRYARGGSEGDEGVEGARHSLAGAAACGAGEAQLDGPDALPAPPLPPSHAPAAAVVEPQPRQTGGEGDAPRPSIRSRLSLKHRRRSADARGTQPAAALVSPGAVSCAGPCATDGSTRPVADGAEGARTASALGTCAASRLFDSGQQALSALLPGDGTRAKNATSPSLRALPAPSTDVDASAAALEPPIETAKWRMGGVRGCAGGEGGAQAAEREPRATCGSQELAARLSPPAWLPCLPFESPASPPPQTPSAHPRRSPSAPASGAAAASAERLLATHARARAADGTTRRITLADSTLANSTSADSSPTSGAVHGAADGAQRACDASHLIAQGAPERTNRSPPLGSPSPSDGARACEAEADDGDGPPWPPARKSAGGGAGSVGGAGGGVHDADGRCAAVVTFRADEMEDSSDDSEGRSEGGSSSRSDDFPGLPPASSPACGALRRASGHVGELGARGGEPKLRGWGAALSGAGAETISVALAADGGGDTQLLPPSPRLSECERAAAHEVLAPATPSRETGGAGEASGNGGFGRASDYALGGDSQSPRSLLAATPAGGSQPSPPGSAKRPRPSNGLPPSATREPSTGGALDASVVVRRRIVAERGALSGKVVHAPSPTGARNEASRSVLASCEPLTALCGVHARAGGACLFEATTGADGDSACSDEDEPPARAAARAPPSTRRARRLPEAYVDEDVDEDAFDEGMAARCACAPGGGLHAGACGGARVGAAPHRPGAAERPADSSVVEIDLCGESDDDTPEMRSVPARLDTADDGGAAGASDKPNANAAAAGTIRCGDGREEDADGGRVWADEASDTINDDVDCDDGCGAARGVRANATRSRVQGAHGIWPGGSVESGGGEDSVCQWCGVLMGQGSLAIAVHASRCPARPVAAGTPERGARGGFGCTVGLGLGVGRARSGGGLYGDDIEQPSSCSDDVEEAAEPTPPPPTLVGSYPHFCSIAQLHASANGACGFDWLAQFGGVGGAVQCGRTGSARRKQTTPKPLPQPKPKGSKGGKTRAKGKGRRFGYGRGGGAPTAGAWRPRRQ